MKTLATTLLLGLGLALPASAQSLDPSRSVQPVDGPPQRYTLDYATGTLARADQRDAGQVGQHATAAVAYQNDCTTGSFVGAGSDELVDWGTKSAGLSTIVTSFEFAYATDAADPSIGGPGASIDVAFYEGTTGSGVLGTEVARFSFTGLPASTSGGFSGFIVTVDLTGGFELCLADGPIGYGYCTSDPGTTGPLITNIATCNNGQQDLYDAWVCPASSSGSFVGTFWFGGSPTASFYMVLHEDDGSDVATTAVNNGSGVNPLRLDDGGTPPVLGEVWPLMADTGAGGHAFSGCLWYKGALPPGTLLTSAGEVILDLTTGQDFVSIVAGTGINDHSVQVPKDTTLLGFDYTVQALLYGGAPPQLTNALDIHIGF